MLLLDLLVIITDRNDGRSYSNVTRIRHSCTSRTPRCGWEHTCLTSLNPISNLICYILDDLEATDASFVLRKKKKKTVSCKAVN